MATGSRPILILVNRGKEANNITIASTDLKVKKGAGLGNKYLISNPFAEFGHIKKKPIHSIRKKNWSPLNFPISIKSSNLHRRKNVGKTLLARAQRTFLFAPATSAFRGQGHGNRSGSPQEVPLPAKRWCLGIRSVFLTEPRDRNLMYLATF